MTCCLHTYIALLRGINVGGNNIIKMTELKASFEKMGFTDVTTYIQSGNVLFKSPSVKVRAITSNLEETLSEEFAYKSSIVLVTDKQLKSVVKNAPRGFGSKPEEYRYDVIFLKESVNPKEAVKSFELKEGVDHVYEGRDVIYFSRLIKKATQSKLSRIVALPIYKSMTIRNWNTTTKLHALAEKL